MENEWGIRGRKSASSSSGRVLHGSVDMGRIWMEVALEEIIERLVEIDARSLIQKAMDLAEIPIEFELDPGRLERARHAVRVADVDALIVGAMSEEDGHPNFVGVLRGRDLSEIGAVRPSGADQNLVRCIESIIDIRRNS